MSALLEAADRIREWHGTLAPWVHEAEEAAMVFTAFGLFAVLYCMFA